MEISPLKSLHNLIIFPNSGVLTFVERVNVNV